ncbi:S41 family peptidase [Maricaulis parjimensis]|uniref:S41 family peptidase n=1 Tax=Maricaulis parjimensis TaxID=144023 RepID=UPI00193986AE|nr:S41 family peptidase [Maricaulis parjimensis]
MKLFQAACLMLAVTLPAQADEAEPLSEQEAREEVERVYTRIMTEHPDPLWYTSEADWEDHRDTLLSRTGEITHERQYFDLAGLMSLAMDTHVQIYPEADTPGFETSYPLRFRLLADGVCITAADDPYRDWVGGCIETINGRPMAAELDRIEDYAFSDNPLRRRSWAAEQWLMNPAAHRYFGWQNEEGVTPLRLRMPDGERRQLALDHEREEPVDTVLRSGRSQAYYWPEDWRTLDDLAASPTPLSRSRLEENFWATDLAGGNILYIQVNTTSDRADGTRFIDFTLDLFQELRQRQNTPERIILDLRYNLGGWISRSLPMAFLTQSTGVCCRRGSVVVLTGPETISAGSVFAGAMEIATRPVVIGQPTGGRPNLFIGHSGETLAHSGLWAEVASEAYYGTDTSDNRHFVAPDIPVEENLADLIAGRDRALEAALALTEEQAEAFYPGDTPGRPWTRPSQEQARPDTD